MTSAQLFVIFFSTESPILGGFDLTNVTVIYYTFVIERNKIILNCKASVITSRI